MGLMREQTCLDVQKGFVKGRSMTNNMLDIEAKTLHWYCQHLYRDTGLVAFDVKAAFPSLLHN
eukprot:8857558-Pyramimonas_sp.AAC.1